MSLIIELLQVWTVGALAVGLVSTGADAWHAFRGKR